METFHYLIGQDTPHIAWWQMSLRAVIIFLYAILLYRLTPRRSFSNLSAQDIVLSVILGSSLSRALTGNAPLLPTLAATGLLVGTYVGVSALAPRSKLISHLVKGRPITLVREGKVDGQAFSKARFGENDIEELLRLNGLRNLSEVEEAHLERNGQVSVIPKSGT
ncbi:putative membrane protein [Pseudooceanicola batsensis HTCC2597]|uniref:Putative membrane protein n=1 Tax=Pseudooceanicola batsensis (strain ATCC BAA-863 / DSM 15984 / KCTC 12145 / HTCC2597) TaxID=252305 RepID=A3U1D9_PSEBH|nr:YetF domain-containing protein [Pseudooceanicola batsensis]EAQ02122.1 putative membrane protein [Pseudooceanicola batsensis HTCC2597]